ncbi:MAG: Smr/MutS family protein [Sphingomonadales bacterium]
MTGRHRKKGDIAPEDAALWERVARETTPLRRRGEDSDRPAPKAQPKVRSREPDRETPPSSRPPTPPRPAGSVPAQPGPASDLAGIDGGLAKRLRRGRAPVEARIDLHGMTQAAAHGALNRFLARSRDRGLRCVLVITGKGLFKRPVEGQVDDASFMRRDEAGVLRSVVPAWLREGENRERVIGFHPAQPRDGGAGALYVLLRRRKTR